MKRFAEFLRLIDYQIQETQPVEWGFPMGSLFVDFDSNNYFAQAVWHPHSKTLHQITTGRFESPFVYRWINSGVRESFFAEMNARKHLGYHRETPRNITYGGSISMIFLDQEEPEELFRIIDLFKQDLPVEHRARLTTDTYKLMAGYTDV